jgi:asparagine synthase (glutamine-hydrolysing)
MCGIAGALQQRRAPIDGLQDRLGLMNDLQAHRGPDGQGVWLHPDGHLGFGHRRLSIIDLDHGAQPMRDERGNVLTFNGEIYNYRELREELGRDGFVTESDTEVILHAYAKWGADCVDHLRGMFAFALWDEQQQTLFCARDRFGIKPLYYAEVGGTLYFASEAKALLPFFEQCETDVEGLKDYLAFQFCLTGKTLFRGIQELLPGHVLTARRGQLQTRRYWEVYFDLDLDHTESWFERQIQELLEDSVRFHLRSDVPVGAYTSGGLDSSIVASLAARMHDDPLLGFVGRFREGPEFDESRYAEMVARDGGFELIRIDIGVDDFLRHVGDVIYHLDQPVAGPGSFPQYMVSAEASRHRKVVLGGQGGDEIFGGYTRYLVAYFEQCIKAAIDGTMDSGNFIVTYESIIPNLRSLKNYKPMLQEFWKEGLFEDHDRRYYRLVNRAPSLGDEIRWDALGDYSPYETFRSIYYADNVEHTSYFDSMTHFDFKTLLPALLQVEDRVSMAHGLEARVPFLDHPLIELAARIPANVKFKNGTMKHALNQSMRHVLPQQVADRTDKMGFPVPLTRWIAGPARDFVHDTLSSASASTRPFVDNERVLAGLGSESKFGRKIWGLLSLELWHQAFHDRHAEVRKRLAT